jgi:hypothetical protein
MQFLETRDNAALVDYFCRYKVAHVYALADLDQPL